MVFLRANLVEIFFFVMNAVEDDCQVDSVYMKFFFIRFRDYRIV
jgi:hypothetical protein